MSCITCQKTAHYQEQGTQRVFCDAKCQKKFADMSAIGWSIFDDWNEKPGGIVPKDIVQIFASIMSDPWRLQHFCYQIESTDRYLVRRSIAARIPKGKIRHAVFLHVCWNHFSAALSAILLNAPTPIGQEKDAYWELSATGRRALLNIGVLRVLQSSKVPDTKTMDCIMRLREAGADLNQKMVERVDAAAQTSKLSFIRYVVETGLFDPSQPFAIAPRPVRAPTSDEDSDEYSNSSEELLGHEETEMYRNPPNFLYFCVSRNYYKAALYVLKDGRCGNPNILSAALFVMRSLPYREIRFEIANEILKNSDVNPNKGGAGRSFVSHTFYTPWSRTDFAYLLLNDPYNRMDDKAALKSFLKGLIGRSLEQDEQQRCRDILDTLLARNRIPVEEIEAILRKLLAKRGNYILRWWVVQRIQKYIKEKKPSGEPDLKKLKDPIQDRVLHQ